jgi:hypothetical protein
MTAARRMRMRMTSKRTRVMSMRDDDGVYAFVFCFFSALSTFALVAWLLGL